MSLALSEHLPLIAAAPDGIRKLRRLILELAIKGLFTNSDTTKWTSLTLGDIGEWGSGGTPLKAHPDYYDGNIPWLVIGDLNDGLVTSAQTHISEKGLSNSSAKLVPPGTLLVAMYGSIGKLGISAIECATNQAIAHCKLTKGLADTQYIFYFIRAIRDQLLSSGQGLAQQNISQKILKATPLILPPLKEQHRIVAKVDELMALCDRLESEQNDSAAAHGQLVETLLGTLTQSADAADFETNWKRISDNFVSLFTTEVSIDSIKKAVLRLALTGKLVRQSPEDEPADLLLQKIAAKKLQLIESGNVKSQKPLAEINDNEKPFELPRGWVWARLQNVIDVRDGTHDSPKDSSEPETYPLVTSKNFINGEIDFISARRISALDHFEIAKRSAVEKFDILFSMIGGNLGNQVMVKDERPFSIKNVALFKYYDNKMTSPFFVKKYMEHLAIDLQNQASGGAQPFVSLGHLRNLVFALPPMAEQLRIVAKVDALMSVCESLKAKLAAAEREQSALAETLIKRALPA